MDYAKESMRLHGDWKGKIEVISKVPVATKEDLSLAYTPGVFRGAFDVRASDINEQMKMVAAEALAGLISDEGLNENYIIPDAFDPPGRPCHSQGCCRGCHKIRCFPHFVLIRYGGISGGWSMV